MRKFLLCSMIIVFLSAWPAHANLFVNGSFEESGPLGPQLNFPVGSTDITGWTVINGTVDYMDSDNSDPGLHWQAVEGARSIDLAGSPGVGGIEQSISTVAGADYTVSFALAGNPTPSGSNPPIKTLMVSAAGQSETFTFDTTGKTFTEMGWEHRHWTFTATDTVTTVTFTNAMTADGAELYGPVIDDVQIAVFFDDFESGASSLWGNERGNWLAVNGNYGAQSPDNIPPTFSSLPFLLHDFAIEFDLNGVSDGGVWLRSNFEGANATGVLLVTGGWQRTGTGLYWHVVHDDGYTPALNEHPGLFTQGEDIHLRIDVSGNTYTAYFNHNPIPATTLTTDDFQAGYVGLYDYSDQRFDNIVVTAETAWPDVEFDGIVNLIDFCRLADNWLDDECHSGNVWCDQADFDFTGTVTLTDLLILADYWL